MAYDEFLELAKRYRTLAVEFRTCEDGARRRELLSDMATLIEQLDGLLKGESKSAD
jgi:hypothetical protein